MSFLTLDGIELPVATESASFTDDSLKATGRATDGTILRSVAAELRGLELQTTPLVPDRGQALADFVRSRGDRWGFDLDGGVVDLYSAKGRYALGLPSYRTRRAERIASAAGLVTVPKLGDGCIEISGATTNLLAANVAGGTDASSNTTGFSATDGATLTSSTATAWEGSRSLRCVTSSTANGTRGGWSTTLAVTGGLTYAASVYLKAASGTPTIRAYLLDSTGAQSSTVTVALSSEVWTRVELSLTTDGAATTLTLHVLEDTADAGITFYADGLQVEANGFCTAWTSPAVSQAAGALSYRLAEHQAGDGLTVMAWLLPRGDGGVAWQVGTASECVRLALSLGTTAAVAATGGSAIFASAAGATTSGAWRHVAVVVRRAPQLGAHSLELYTDGGLTASIDGALPVLSRPTLYVGTDASGANHWNGLLDELVVLPTALTADMIAALYTRALDHWPDHMVGGDLVGAPSAEHERQMAGEITSDRPTQVALGGSWQNRARTLGLKLTQSRVG